MLEENTVLAMRHEMEIMLLIYDVDWESRKSGVRIVRKKKKRQLEDERKNIDQN